MLEGQDMPAADAPVEPGSGNGGRLMDDPWASFLLCWKG